MVTDIEMVKDDKKPANWIERLLKIRSRWAEKQNDELDGDHEEEKGCDETFSSTAKEVSWSDTQIFSQLPFLCNMKYVIPEIEDDDLRRYYDLISVTSSLEKKALAEAIARDSTRVPVNNSTTNQKPEKQITRTSAYEIAASAAAYVQSQAGGGLINCEEGDAKADCSSRVANGSDSVASWQANLGPTKFEMTVGLESGPCFLINPYISTSDVKTDSRIKRVLDNFDFQGKLGFVQFWECWASADPEDNGCYLLLTDHLRVSEIHDNRTEAYRWTCLKDNFRFVGREKNVGNWYAGRAAQTQVADYQYDGEASGMGQLVVPVFHPGAVPKLDGILEIVTAQRNETYSADFIRIQSSLMTVNLTSTYLGKTFKVQHRKELVKFTLPFLAKRADLQEQVIMRFNELENKAFSIAYTDTNNIRHSIKSDHDLQCCIADSISNSTTLIRMFVEDVVG